MKGDAVFSPDKKYRYMLSRTWADGGLSCLFVGLNPSTADEVKNDPTITRCVHFARDWGYSSMLFGNIFALRSTDPRKLYIDADPVGPENDVWLVKMTKAADRVIICWGEHGRCKNRGYGVMEMLGAGRDLYCFVLNKSGQPKHPLYLPRSSQVRPIRELDKFLTKEWLEWKREQLRTPEEFKKMYIGEFVSADN